MRLCLILQGLWIFCKNCKCKYLAIVSYPSSPSPSGTDDAGLLYCVQFLLMAVADLTLLHSWILLYEYLKFVLCMWSNCSAACFLGSECSVCSVS